MSKELTPEQQELLANPTFYDGRNRAWTPNNLAQAYDLYNRIFGTNKKDNSCPSCRRQVVETLKAEYAKALKAKKDEGNG